MRAVQSGAFLVLPSATSLADVLGIDFALINRNRRREQARRQRAASLEQGNADLSASQLSNFSEVANGVHSLSESGEWFITEESGRRLRSGGHRRTNTGVDSDAGVSEDENDSKMEVLVGEVAGRTAILIDDMIDTGRTLALASKTLEAAGVKRVYAVISHGLLSGRAMDLIKRLNLERLIVTNTISNQDKARNSNDKLQILDMSAVIAETIRRSHHGESISTMFRQDAEMMF